MAADKYKLTLLRLS